MKSFATCVLLVGLFVASLALRSADVSAWQQAPDRSVAPKPGPPPALKLPPIQKRTLSNGLPVWIVELHKVPVVHVSLVIRSGSSGASIAAHRFGWLETMTSTPGETAATTSR